MKVLSFCPERRDTTQLLHTILTSGYWQHQLCAGAQLIRHLVL